MSDEERCFDRDSIGEAIHTAFRKASDSPASAEIWELIMKMPDEEWSGIVDFIWECMWPPSRPEEGEKK